MEDKNIKLPKSFKIYLMILLVLAVIFINSVSRNQIFSTLNLFSKPQKELELVNGFAIDKEVEKIDIFNKKVIVWKDKNLSFLDFNGFETLKKNFEFKDADIILGKEILYVMDRSSGSLYLLDKTGKTIERLDLKTPFSKLKEKGENIYIYRKDGDKENVDIVDRKGNILKTHKEKIPILDITTGNKDRKYLVSTLDIDKNLKSIVSIYSIEGKNIGSIELKDELVVYNEFIGDKIIIATEKNIYLLEDEKIKWDKKIDNLKDIKVVNKDIYVLYNNKFETIDLKGNTKEEVVLTLDLENIRFIEDSILLFGKRNILMPQKKKDILSFKTKEDILDLKYDDGNLLIQKQGKVEIYNIREKGDK
ncbi:DUF5711 family protein [Tissierella creatinophila]|uniref:Uncharacterized protein n=1 Tax=Tissierella creatinophila DSM 6911 TaxID=1123403 RepID=A0A1U7M830_TISCR|nr:DUF5711 family protein [Tissierella creatinophila]OLS03410.1 hypothetical protein TICRE_05220 [Tissierella creatinophila DSM 6911]